MSKTAIVFSPKYYEHNPGSGHPESALRLRSVINELQKGGLSRNRNWQFVHPEKAHLEDVELVHYREYIKLVKAICEHGGGILDSGDTVASGESFETALYAVGGTIKAVNLLWKRNLKMLLPWCVRLGTTLESFVLRAFAFSTMWP